MRSDRLKKNDRRRRAAPLLARLAAPLAAAALLCGCAPRETPPEPEEPPVLYYHNTALPLLENVPVNELDASAFRTDENGWLRYRDAPMGIDVSTHQKEIDWEQVAEAGVEFAMIRAGRRGYTEGGLYEDEFFRRNIEGATAAGLDVGVYFFSQAVDVAEAREEAAYLLELIEGCAVTYPVVFDWEPITNDDARTDGLGGAELTACARAFCKDVAAAGYTPAVYFNVEQGYLRYRLDQLTDYVFWLAEYHDAPSFYYGFDLWQYTSSGSVAGIEGSVDLDLDLRGVR